MQTALSQVVASNNECFSASSAKHSSAPHFNNILANFQNPDLRLLTIKATPTDAEVESLIAHYTDEQECRRLTLEGLASIHPALVTWQSGCYARSDAALVRLVRQEVTYGDHNAAALDRFQRCRSELFETAQAIDAQTANAHAYEMQQRQNAARALQQWSYQQSIVQSLNRPRMTNCTYNGPFLNCVTN